MSTLSLSLRNLTRQKRRSFLLGGAVAFGLMILTAFNGCAGGVSNAFEQNISSIAVGHIFYTVAERETEESRMTLNIRDDRAILQAIVNAEIPVQHIVRRTQSVNIATLIYQGATVSRSLEGIKWDEDPLLLENLLVTDGSMENLKGTDGIVVSESVVKKLNADIGDRILVQMSTLNGQQNVAECEIRAVYQDTTGLFSFSAYLDQDYMNKLIDLPVGSYNLMGIFLKNINRASESVAKIDAELRKIDPSISLNPPEWFAGRGFQRTIEDFRRDNSFTVGQKHIMTNLKDEPTLKTFLDVLRYVQIGAAVFVLILLMIVMVGIINTYRIIVQERRREIGTMRALGMPKGEVVRLFIYEALSLVGIGVLVGLFLGLLVLIILGLGEDMYVLGGVAEFGFFLLKKHLAWKLNFGLLGLTVGIVFIMTVIAAWIPARKAGKLQPAAALRM